MSKHRENYNKEYYQKHKELWKIKYKKIINKEEYNKYMKEYMAKRRNNPLFKEKILEAMRKSYKKWYQKPGNKEKVIKWQKEHKYSSIQRKRYPEKFIARDKISYAIRSKKITRQPCSICGEIKSHAHHPDYNKPLEIMWLCSQHHADIHRGVLNATNND